MPSGTINRTRVFLVAFPLLMVVLPLVGPRAEAPHATQPIGVLTLTL